VTESHLRAVIDRWGLSRRSCGNYYPVQLADVNSHDVKAVSTLYNWANEVGEQPETATAQTISESWHSGAVKQTENDIMVSQERFTRGMMELSGVSPTGRLGRQNAANDQCIFMLKWKTRSNMLVE